MTDKRIVMTTAGSVDEARRIAETLVDHKLAACVNIVPKIVSIYRWKGKVEEAEEWLLWIKTAGGKGYDYGHGIAVDAHGNAYVTGSVVGFCTSIESPCGRSLKRRCPACSRTSNTSRKWSSSPLVTDASQA